MLSPDSPLLVLTPIIGFAAGVLVHIILLRLKKSLPNIICIIAGFVVGLPIAVFITLGSFSSEEICLDLFASLIINATAFCALWYCYFHFVNITVVSLRIRVLDDLYRCDTGMSKKEILGRYNAGDIITNRAQRMVISNQLLEKNGRYYPGKNKIFLFLFWVFEFLKYTILGQGNQFIPAEYRRKPTLLEICVLFWQNQFLRFLCIGVINTIFGYSMYAALVLIGLNYHLALTAGTILAVLFNYYTNGRFVFLNKGRIVLLKFILLNIVLYFFNLVLLTIFVDYIGAGKLISQAIIVPIIIVTSFIINKLWVFRKKTVN
ncbi:MAG: GtrA family protein [Sedimentisphaerales bacterium]|nr:GtrA family protein [Sedimentisphaerales bacterium]